MSVEDEWYRRRTSRSEDWPAERVAAGKQAHRISVVIPARNEQHTVGDVVTQIRTALVDDVPLVDELVVMDSLSTDATASVAADAGARVVSVADVMPQLGVQPGKGETLWKSLFVTDGDLLVFIDADLTEWGPHFVAGLVGPLLADEKTLLVKGFYDRVDTLNDEPGTQGGRVTELVARPLLNLRWPTLSRVVQPLAGEWSARRELMESLYVPVGYGIELATLIDTEARHGLDAVAQVDLGRRAHQHQKLHDLGAMAIELIAVADRRSGLDVTGPAAPLLQYERGRPGQWHARQVPVTERPPATRYPGRAAC